MNRRIPNGAYGLFRHPVEGSRNGRVLLVEAESLADPEHGGRYTVKIYRRRSEGEVALEPDSDVDGYEPIVVRGPEDAVRVVAELVEALPSAASVVAGRPTVAAFEGDLRVPAFDPWVEEVTPMHQGRNVDPPPLVLATEEEAALRIGLGRVSMDVRWLAHLDDGDLLHLWRSWTGSETYAAQFEREGDRLVLRRLAVEQDAGVVTLDDPASSFLETVRHVLDLAIPSRS